MLHFYVSHEIYKYLLRMAKIDLDWFDYLKVFYIEFHLHVFWHTTPG